MPGAACAEAAQSAALTEGSAMATNSPFPMNAQMREVIEAHQKTPVPSVENLPAKVARMGPTPATAAAAVAKKRGLATAPEAIGFVEDIKIPAPSGDLPARIYTPDGTGPFPVLVYFHGGGWVLADLDTYDASARALTNAARCIVVSVHYRQAPEHKFPAAAEDADFAFQWAQRNAASFKGDPNRVAVGGESAGGNLATGVALQARERGGPMPIHQLLVYPVTVHAFDSPSYQQYADAQPLNAPMMHWFWEQYLENDADGQSPLASPLLAADLSGLPPATVILAEIDPLRSEGEAYAARLQQAGVPTTVTIYPGVTHEFFGMTAVVDEAKRAVAEAAAGLTESFGGNASPSATARRRVGPADRAYAAGPNERIPTPASAAPGVRSAAETGSRMTVGMEVFGADGERVGQVKEIRDTDFLVDRPMARDIYVPFDAVSQTGPDIRLSVTAHDVGERDWPRSSLI
ncbi:MAG: alpha/beta hydrolase fold domain-containing protein [Chloroflexi bacterium]|nr:alpha/beta hydrolase fold domain-containing protein [Chloroflexota bacterium]